MGLRPLTPITPITPITPPPPTQTPVHSLPLPSTPFHSLPLPSTPFAQDSPFEAFYYPLLRRGVHYLPLRRNLSDVCRLLRGLVAELPSARRGAAGAGPGGVTANGATDNAPTGIRTGAIGNRTARESRAGGRGLARAARAARVAEEAGRFAATYLSPESVRQLGSNRRRASAGLEPETCASRTGDILGCLRMQAPSSTEERA